MVTLRQRGTRPSYATILNLTDDEMDADDAEVGSDGAPRAGPSRRPRSPSGAPSSLSSGGSGSFQPSPEKSQAALSDDDDAELDDGEDEKDGDDGDEADADAADLGEIVGSPTPWARRRQPLPSAPQQIFTGSSAFPLADGASPYAALMRVGLERVAKGEAGTGWALEGKPKAPPKPLMGDVTLIPPGPVGPLTVRLAKRVMRGDSEVGVVDHGGAASAGDAREERRRRTWAIARNFMGEAPWETWEGQGWWPPTWEEAAQGTLAKGKGKRKAPDEEEGSEAGGEAWAAREELRVGYDAVGRYTLDQLSLLSASQAKPYLPLSQDPLGRPGSTVFLGPPNKQRPHVFKLFDAINMQNVDPLNSGFLLGTGGPIWGMEWAPYPDRLAAAHEYKQYLAISTLPSSADAPTLGARAPAATPAAIQIWSILPPTEPDTLDGSARCELVVCVEGGPAMQVRWAPVGGWDEPGEGPLPKLGILGAVQLDGTVKLYAVPHPAALRAARLDSIEDPLFLKLDPLVVLDTPDATATCLEWMTGTRLAVGLANGHAIIYDLLDALLESRQGVVHDPLPSIYVPLAQSPIRALASSRLPPDVYLPTSAGSAMGAAPPPHLVAPPYLIHASLDGTSGLTDLRDPALHTHEYTRARNPLFACAWSNHVNTAVVPDHDYVVGVARSRVELAGRVHGVTAHRGPVWDIATSEYHAMVLTAGSDGAVLLGSAYLGPYRRKKHALLFQRLLEFDYATAGPQTGSFRLSTHFTLEETSHDHTVSRATGGAKDRDPSRAQNEAYTKTAAWDAHVAVHAAAWQSGAGIGRAGWAAVGGAAGVGVVMWIEGRWLGARPDEFDA
ncbi:hypothetical protein Q5752_006764 [Cryptotrichosporon argae]